MSQVVVPKKNDKWEAYVDFEPLNASMKQYHFILPFLDEIVVLTIQDHVEKFVSRRN